MRDGSGRLAVDDRQRILIVDHLLNSTDYCAVLDNSKECGIHKLIAKKAFKKAYPLHDSNPSTGNNRRRPLRCLSRDGK